MGNLFKELKRRKVFRVAAVYAVAAWVLVQVADVVLPTFGAPTWVGQTLIFLLTIGIVPTLVAAWAYEITPEGIRTDSAVQVSSQSTPVAANNKLIYATFILVLLVVGIQLSDRFLFTSQQNANLPVGSLSSAGAQVVRFSIPVSEDSDVFLGDWISSRFGWPTLPSLVFSNDGETLIYSGWSDSGGANLQSQLYKRALNQSQAVAIAGTEGAFSPFLSPDSSWIGYFSINEQADELQLMRIPFGGGNSESIAVLSGVFGPCCAAWGESGSIVFADTSGRLGIYQIPSGGGAVELIAYPEQTDTQHNFFTAPTLIPGSDLVLFHGHSTERDPLLSEIFALDITTGSQSSLLTNAMNPLYVAQTGHLLFLRQGALMAVPFDLEQIALTGEPLLVEDNVLQALRMPNSRNESGIAQFSVSSSGHLAFATGGEYPIPSKSLVLVQPDGNQETLNSVSLSNLDIGAPRLSPSGTSVAFFAANARSRGRERTLFVHDLERDVTVLLETGGFVNSWPIWSPDGQSLLFSSNFQDDVMNIYRIAADGSDERPQRLAPSERNQFPGAWSSQGVFFYLEAGDIWALTPEGVTAPFFTSDAAESFPSVSPDGEWVVYQASGTIFVRPYPGPDPAIVVAGTSGAPAWSSDGTQLYFLRFLPENNRFSLMVADFDDGDVSPARTLIEDWRGDNTVPLRNYDVFPDGSFLTTVVNSADNDVVSQDRPLTMLDQFRSAAVEDIQVVLNFTEELRQRFGQ